jgi:murein DD-endopeptidase MepM/ murein hydrolase activator NlpD
MRLAVLALLAAMLSPLGGPVPDAAAGAAPTPPVSGAATSSTADPRWVFYSNDTTRYGSPWYARRHRKMVPYGCTRAPYYSPDPRCAKQHGFHHGLDLAMNCGTRLFAGRAGTVVSNAGLGPAYGVNPLLIRNGRLHKDFLLAHTRRVFVEPGDRVRRGMLIAKASDSGAPDGCHLHFEVRAAGGGLDSARRPARFLDLRP